jgi:hypothetical protein
LRDLLERSGEAGAEIVFRGHVEVTERGAFIVTTGLRGAAFGRQLREHLARVLAAGGADHEGAYTALQRISGFLDQRPGVDRNVALVTLARKVARRSAVGQKQQELVAG